MFNIYFYCVFLICWAAVSASFWAQ